MPNVRRAVRTRELAALVPTPGEDDLVGLRDGARLTLGGSSARVAPSSSALTRP